MNVLRPILTFFFAVLVFLSGSSFIVGIHFCSGSPKNIALFAKAEGCEKEKKLPPCHRHEAPPCCEDETVYHEGLGFKDTAAQITFATPTAVDVVNTPAFISEIINPVAARTVYHNYDPPLRTCDRTVSLQVFLI